MADQISFAYLDYRRCNDFTGNRSIHFVRIQAISLLPYLNDGKSFPLASNVRAPGKGKVVNSILSSLEKGKELNRSVEIQSEIILCAYSVSVREGKIYIVFGKKGGILDGGHRFYSLVQACLLRIGNLANVYLTFKIVVGASEEEIQEMAIALNTSKNPKNFSVANFRGNYDWIKEPVKGFEIMFYENQPGVSSDPYCNILRVFALVMLVNPKISPLRPYGGSGRKKMARHPISVVSTGSMSFHTDINNQWKEEGHDITFIIQDVLRLQTLIALELESFHQRSALPFVQNVSSPHRGTYLPTGERLSIKLPSKLYVYPILSAFRAAINADRPEWIVPDILIFAKKPVKQMIRRYAEILAQGRFVNRRAISVETDEYIWDCMYGIAAAAVESLAA